MKIQFWHRDAKANIHLYCSIASGGTLFIVANRLEEKALNFQGFGFQAHSSILGMKSEL